MVSHLLKIGTRHWIPHWKCTVLAYHIAGIIDEALILTN